MLPTSRREHDEKDAAILTSLALEECGRRANFLDREQILVPYPNSGLSTIAICPRKFLEFLTIQLDVANIGANLPCFIDEFAFHIKNPQYGSSILRLELQVKTTAILAQLQEIVAEFLYLSTRVIKREGSILHGNVRTIVVREIPRDTLAKAFLFTEDGTITIGHKIQIVIQCADRSLKSRISPVKVSVFENWISYINKQALDSLSSLGMELSNVPLFPYHTVALTSAGVHFENEKAARACALRALKLERRPIPQSFAAFQCDYPPQSFGRTVEFFNWMSLLQPEAEFKTLQEAMIEAEGKLNPLATCLIGKGHQEVNAILTWVEEVLFLESKLRNPAITQSRTRPQQLCLKNNTLTRHIVVKGDAQQHCTALFNAWRYLETVFSDRKESPELLRNLLSTLHCRSIAFNDRDKLRACLTFLERTNIDPMQVYTIAKNTIEEHALKQLVWRKKLSNCAAHLRSDAESKELDEIHSILKQPKLLDAPKILRLAQLLIHHTPSPELHTALVSALFYLFNLHTSNPNAPMLHAIQKLFFTIEGASPLPSKARESALSSLIAFYRLFRGPVDHPLYLSGLGDFLDYLRQNAELIARDFQTLSHEKSEKIQSEFHSGLMHLASTPISRRYVYPLYCQYLSMGLIQKDLALVIVRKTFEITPELPLSEAVDLFIQMFEAPPLFEDWKVFIANQGLMLFDMFGTNLDPIQVKRLYDLLQEKRLLKKLDDKLKFLLAVSLVRFDPPGMFFNVWKTISKNYVFKETHAMDFAHQCAMRKTVEHCDVILHLHRHFNRTHINFLKLYLAAITPLEPLRPSILKTIVEELDFILKHPLKLSEADQKGASHNLEKEFILAIFLGFSYCVQMMVQTKTSEERVRLSNSIRHLIKPVLECIPSRLAHELKIAYQQVFYACIFSDDPNTLTQLAEICRSGHLPDPGETAVQFLAQYFNIDSDELLKSMQKVTLEVVKNAFDKKWLVVNPKHEEHLGDTLCKSGHLKNRRQLNVAFKVLKLWIANSQEGEKKEGASVEQPRSLLVIPIAEGYVKLGLYEKLAVIDRFAKTVCKGKNWQHYLNGFLNSYLNILEPLVSKRETLKTAMHSLKTLFPLIVSSSPKAARAILKRLGSIEIMNFADVAIGDLETIHQTTTATGLCKDHPQERLDMDFILMWKNCLDLSEASCKKSCDLFEGMLQYADPKVLTLQGKLNGSALFLNQRILIDALLRKTKINLDLLKAYFTKIRELKKLPTGINRLMYHQYYFCSQILGKLFKFLKANPVVQPGSEEFQKQFNIIATECGEELTKELYVDGKECPELGNITRFHMISLLKNLNKEQWQILIDPASESVIIEGIDGLLRILLNLAPSNQKIVTDYLNGPANLKSFVLSRFKDMVTAETLERLSSDTHAFLQELQQLAAIANRK